MSLAELLVLAVALSLDALAVSVAAGLSGGMGQIWRMALAFGGFQFLMPVLGWLLGSSAYAGLESFDHWVAFGLLALVGGKMLRDAWRGREAERPASFHVFGLLALAVATSLDALAVGVSLAMLRKDIWLPAAFIGLVCFLLSAAGGGLGHLAGRRSETGGRIAAGLGGLGLLSIGVKILLEHRAF